MSHYLGIEAQLPDFRWRSFESGNGSVGIYIEDPNKAVERGRGGDEARGVSRHGRNAEAVARVGALQDQFVGPPELHSLVQRPGEQKGTSGIGGRDPRSRPHRLIVGVLDGFQACQLHFASTSSNERTLAHCSFSFLLSLVYLFTCGGRASVFLFIYFLTE